MTFKQALISIIGSYSNMVVQYGNDYYTIPDIEYIASFIMLCIFIICIFKLIGGIICRM